MPKFPFEVPTSEWEICRWPSKDGKSVFVITQQLFNVAIQRYTEPIYWDTQW